MNKQQSNQMASMRKKLLAAIAMLLVACIMTVSSTYAWFTLSTAPEVKGISTTIGANGNLEMALGTYETFFGTTDPSAHVGSSFDVTANWVNTNITWGNLVDLSDGSYGLNKIKLYPSRLNASGNTLNLLNPLQYPSYGSDGRITALKDTTMLGKYDVNAEGFMGLAAPNYAGVNAIGSASSMSERAFAVRNGKASLESNRVAAINAAKEGIRDYAGDLAGLAIKNMSSDDAAVVTAAEKEVLKNLITKLQQSNVYVSESMKSGILVILAAWTTEGDTALSDDAWKIAVGAAEDKDIAQYVSYLTSNNGNIELPPVVMDKIANYEAINTTLSAALTALGDVAEDGNWGEIKNAVSSLLNASGILICGYNINEIQESRNNPETATKPDAFEKVTAAVMGSGLTFEFSETSGIFADIAEFTGNYSASMTFPSGTKVEGIDLGSLGTKTVTVKSPSQNKATGDLGLVAAFVKDLDATSNNEGNAAKALTDTYGYTIDLLFRTNATDSFLQLQVEGANRYMDGASDGTKGNGSNITFTIDEEYSKEKIEGLAEGIRVVFYNSHNLTSGSANILGVAVLDTANGKVAGDAYKLNLKLINYSIADDGKITEVGDLVDDTTTPQNETIVLCPLTANEKTGISALVYLDGDVIDNSDAGLAAALNGVLNLQFASSVELKPMENADLMGE